MGQNHELLRQLPPVHSILEHTLVREVVESHGRSVVLEAIQRQIGVLREQITNEGVSGDRHALTERLAESVANELNQADIGKLGPVINATGVVLHTGLGRSQLSTAAQAALQELSGASNVELSLLTGERHYRGHQLHHAWHVLTGAEDGLVVNNNAAATLLVLQSLCRDREVIISRGELIEIGGSFRLPDIFELSGARLREVGTTNRTRVGDYQRAIGPDTAAIMKVHPSNYRIVGFHSTPTAAELAAVAHEHKVPLIDDIGSGALVDVTQFGLPAEPTFPSSLSDGADVVLGSGDKLMGGPQAGIILGRGDLVEQIRQHPLARAVRVGKLTLAALSATLDSYLRGTALSDIPTLSMLAATTDALRFRADAVLAEAGPFEHLQAEVVDERSVVGGGSVPGADLATTVVSIGHVGQSAEELACRLRTGRIRLLCRIHRDRVFVDLRSVVPADDGKVALALRLVDAAAGEP